MAPDKQLCNSGKMSYPVELSEVHSAGRNQRRAALKFQIGQREMQQHPVLLEVLMQDMDYSSE